MRVTDQYSTNKSIFNMEQGRTLLDRLQSQIASGQQVSRPGDNPVATQQIMGANSLLAQTNQYLDTIKTGNMWLNTTTSALQGMSDFMQKIKDTAYSVANGAKDSTTQTTAVSSLTQLRDQLLQLGNTQFDGQYIFGGFKNDKPPFDMSSNDPLVNRQFNGTDDEIKMEIDKSVFQPVNISGGKLLRGVDTSGTATGTDVIGTIDDMITAIKNNDVSGPSGIKALLPKLNDAFDQIQNAQSEVAGRSLRLQSTSNVLGTTQRNLNDAISNIQAVDYAKTITELNSQQTAFEATLSVTAKINQLSLLNYL